MTATPTPRALLDEKRRDLRAAEAQLATAEAALDVDATMAAQQRIAVLRQFIARLEADAVSELEVEGQALAEAWLAAQPKRATARAKAIAAAQNEAQRLLGEALTAMQEETRLRREHAKVASGVRVLTARFPALTPPTLREQPAALDHAFDVLKASNAVLDAANAATVRLAPSVTASMGPDERRRAVLRAIAELIDRRRSVLPPEVGEILTVAPIPPDVLAPKAPPPPSEHERRAAAAMAEAVRVETALSLVGASQHLGRGS